MQRAAVHRCSGIVPGSARVTIPVLRRTTPLRYVLRRARDMFVMSPSVPNQRLYLITPQLDDTASFARDLDAVLAAADIAAILLRLADADERTLIERVKTLAPIVQRRDVALVLAGRPELVARCGADGAHLTGVETFAAALPLLKPALIAGAGGLRSRHDAMLAGENAADYVMFGEPDRRGHTPPLEETQERLEWWAGLIEVPCVGYAGSLGDVETLAPTGADFIALGEWIWTEPQGASAVLAAAAGLLAAAAA
jgi:thiamine-phosphate pyrophosphorylase